MNGERVYLRPITEADTAKIVAWRNQDFVRKNFIDQRLFTEEGHRAWLRERVEPGHVAQFIICVEENACPKEIGSVYLRDIDREAGTAEYGVFIGEEEALGRGYGTAAAKQMVAYGFDTLHLKKIFLRLLEENVAAGRSYEKAGFRRIADRQETVVLEQGRRGVLFMEIGYEEWKRMRDGEKQ